MKEFEATTVIDRRPEEVWSVLVDTGAWPQWDPFCERIDGKVELGGKVKAFTKLAPGRGFGVKVTELVPGERMVWSGGMPFGLFKGVRSYVLAKEGDKTRFTMHEVFSGPMLALIGGSIPDMTEAFQAFARGLKGRVEGAG